MNIRSESHTKVSPKPHSRTPRAMWKNDGAKQQAKPQMAQADVWAIC
jgi:hypothetical protein